MPFVIFRIQHAQHAQGLQFAQCGGVPLKRIDGQPRPAVIVLHLGIGVVGNGANDNRQRGPDQVKQGVDQRVTARDHPGVAGPQHLDIP